MEASSSETNFSSCKKCLILERDHFPTQDSNRIADIKRLRKASMVYLLQKRVRNLREQLQRQDFHLYRLRRKLYLQENSIRMESVLLSEKNEADMRIKILTEQIESLQIQLSIERTTSKRLSAKISEAADYKMASLEKSRKIEEVQNQLVQSEILRVQCVRKLIVVKEEIERLNESSKLERSVHNNSIQLLKDEIARVNQNRAEANLREIQLQNFRDAVAELLLGSICASDSEIISRLQKMIAAHRGFTTVSRRYDEIFEATP